MAHPLPLERLVDIKVKHTPWLYLGHRSVGNVKLLITSFQKRKGLCAPYNHVQKLVTGRRIKFSMCGNNLAQTLRFGTCSAHIVDYLSELAP